MELNEIRFVVLILCFESLYLDKSDISVVELIYRNVKILLSVYKFAYLLRASQQIVWCSILHGTLHFKNSSKCIPNPWPMVVASAKVLVCVQANELFHKWANDWYIIYVCLYLWLYSVDSVARCRASPSLHCISCHELVPAVFSGGLVSPRNETKGSHSQGPQTSQVCSSIISLITLSCLMSLEPPWEFPFLLIHLLV